MLTFLSAVYNEEIELPSLLDSVIAHVDGFAICDDGSTDQTPEILGIYHHAFGLDFKFKIIDHTGLCEAARIEALELVPENSWVLMLDADERISEGDLKEIRKWVDSEESQNFTHVYFNQVEYIDDTHTRTFQKVKLYKKESAHLPEIIHGDPWFDGQHYTGANWAVLHRKSSLKQLEREKQYLVTYRKLLEEGKIDQGRYDWFRGMHYFIKEEPHG